MICGLSSNYHDDDFTLVTDYSYDTYGGDTYSSRTRSTSKAYGKYDDRKSGSLATIGEMFGCSRPNTRNNFYDDDHTLMTRESIDSREDISYTSNKSDKRKIQHRKCGKSTDCSQADSRYTEERDNESEEDEPPISEDLSSRNYAADKNGRRQNRSKIDASTEKISRVKQTSYPHLSKSNLPKTSLADEISVLTKEVEEDPSLKNNRNGDLKNLTLRVPSPTDISSLTMNHYSPAFNKTNPTFKNTNYNLSPLLQYGDYNVDKDNAFVEHRDDIDPYTENAKDRRRSTSNFSSLPQKLPSTTIVDSNKHNFDGRHHSHNCGNTTGTYGALDKPELEQCNVPPGEMVLKMRSPQKLPSTSNVDSNKHNFDGRHNSHNCGSTTGKVHMLSPDIPRTASNSTAASRVKVVDAYGATDKPELEQCNVPPGEMGLKLRSTKEGVMITRKAHNSVCPQLSVGDIIIALDGVDISTFSTKAVKKLLDARETQPNRSIIYKPGFLSQQSQQSQQTQQSQQSQQSVASDQQSWSGSYTRRGQSHFPNSPNQSIRSIPHDGYATIPRITKGNSSMIVNKSTIANYSHNTIQAERSNDMHFHTSNLPPFSTIQSQQNSSNQVLVNNGQYKQRGESLSSTTNHRRSLTSHLQLHHTNFENHNNLPPSPRF